MKKIILTNQKGGVGKTTLTRELGLTLSNEGRRVLLIDSDPQGNLSRSLLRDSRSPGLFEALEGEPPKPVAVSKELFILTGDQRLSLLEKRYLGEVDAYSKLQEVFERLEDFDLVLIDSPPSLGIMTLNGLAASDCFIVPLRPALYSMQGTNDLMGSVAKVKRSLNPDLKLLGVVINDYLRGPVINRQIKAEIEEGFGELVFESVISRSVKVEEAIAGYRGAEGRTADEIKLLGLEILKRIEYENC